MKASVLTAFGGPEVLQLREVETPRPGPGEVLVRVLATGLNRLDHYLREGALLRMPLPHVLGSDAAGVVEEVGEGATRFRPGDRVIPMPGYPLDPTDGDFSPMSAAPSYAIRGVTERGAYAQFMTAPERWLVRDDTGLSPEEVATLPMAVVTAVRAVKTVGGVKEGDAVLVHAGASGTGSMAIQVARALGARVAATVRSPDKAEFVRSLGAELVLETGDAGGDFAGPAREWTGGQGVDVVIDNLGGPVFTQSLGALRPLGTLVSLGLVMGLEATLPLQPFFWAQQQVRGSFMGDVADMEWGLSQIRSGRIRPVLDRALPLKEAPEAHRLLAAGAVRGNLVLLPWE